MMPASSSASKKVLVKSFGCQMNVYDSARMVDILAPHGFTETTELENADLVILNTCHIRERASEKIFSELGKLREMKLERNQSGGELVLAVAGCVAQAEGDEIFRRQKAVDLVVGPQSYHRLPSLVEGLKKKRRQIDTEFPLEDKFLSLTPPTPEKIRSRGVSAFVTIQEGCDKFCTFCVVPYTRGSETSRSVAQVLEEVEHLAAHGVREIVLLGQNVNDYHGVDDGGSSVTLAALISKVAQVHGILRIRYMTSHPLDMHADLISAHATNPTLMPLVHLPVQSGSDRILDAMNRRHTAEDYRKVISLIREAQPDAAFSSDFIVGFPGETDDDFEDTLSLIRDVGFASAYSFKYSARPGTPAAVMALQVPEDIKVERLHRLQTLIELQRHEFNQTMMGRILDVLIERAGRRDDQIVGKTKYSQSVHVSGPLSLVGQIAQVQITEVGTNSLSGIIVAQEK